MNLYLLHNQNANSEIDMEEIIVKAKSADDARMIAAQQSWNEGPNVWLMEEFTSCTLLEADDLGVLYVRVK